MDDFKVLQEIKNDISTIKELMKERNYSLASEQYSTLKDKLRDKEKAFKSDTVSTAYSPHAISEILHKSFTARKGTKEHSKIASCVADADSYIDYYIDRIKND